MPFSVIAETEKGPVHVFFRREKKMKRRCQGLETEELEQCLLELN